MIHFVLRPRLADNYDKRRVAVICERLVPLGYTTLRESEVTCSACIEQMASEVSLVLDTIVHMLSRAPPGYLCGVPQPDRLVTNDLEKVTCPLCAHIASQ